MPNRLEKIHGGKAERSFKTIDLSEFTLENCKKNSIADFQRRAVLSYLKFNRSINKSFIHDNFIMDDELKRSDDSTYIPTGSSTIAFSVKDVCSIKLNSENDEIFDVYNNYIVDSEIKSVLVGTLDSQGYYKAKNIENVIGKDFPEQKKQRDERNLQAKNVLNNFFARSNATAEDPTASSVSSPSSAASAKPKIPQTIPTLSQASPEVAAKNTTATPVVSAPSSNKPSLKGRKPEVVAQTTLGMKMDRLMKTLDEIPFLKNSTDFKNLSTYLKENKAIDVHDVTYLTGFLKQERTKQLQKSTTKFLNFFGASSSVKSLDFALNKIYELPFMKKTDNHQQSYTIFKETTLNLYSEPTAKAPSVK